MFSQILCLVGALSFSNPIRYICFPTEILFFDEHQPLPNDVLLLKTYSVSNHSLLIYITCSVTLLVVIVLTWVESSVPYRVAA